MDAMVKTQDYAPLRFLIADDKAFIRTIAAGTPLSASLIARLKKISEGSEEEARLWVGDR